MFALTTLPTGLVQKAWAKQLWTEAERDNFFAKFTGEGANNIIQVKTDLKKEKGDQITVPLVMRLTGEGVTGDSTLEGNEEKLQMYDCPVTVNQYRHAVRLAGMMEEEDMSVLTKALMAFSDFLINQGHILIIAIIILIIAIRYLLKVDSVRLNFDMIKLKMPVVGPLMGKIYTGRFSRTLSSLYSSGIPMVECLERSSRVLGNKYIDKMFIQVIDEVKQGQPLSTSIQKTEIFESMFCSIIYVGEESGTLDEILAKTADYYEEEADSAISRLVGLMEPLMIIIMGVAIGLCLAGIFPMLYGSMGNIQ